MKKTFRFVLTSLFFLTLGGFVLFRFLLSPLDPDSSSTQFIIIKPRTSVNEIAQTLTQRQLIRSPLVFKLYLRFHQLDNKLQAGRFRLSPHQSLPEIAQTLTHGQLDVWVTIPEGFRREQIASLLQRRLSNFSTQTFLQLTQDKEGQLFPDTYLIPITASPQDVVQLFLQNYQRKLQPFHPQIQQHSLTEKEILTLASIIERETLSDQEKPLVAGILLKRLRHHWPLQVDATIQYILGKPDNWWPVPTVADRRLSSPYNTYLHQGLPPHPIANPGLASIKAVLFPQDSSFWYYLHDKSGKIHYAKTLEQHQQNIRTYLR